MSIKRLSGAGLTTPKSNKLWDQVTFQSGMSALATITLTSTASSVVFSGIPSNYTHLQLRTLVQQASTGGYVEVLFNNATFVRRHWVFGSGGGGSAAAGADATNAPGVFSSAFSSGNSAFASSVVDILNYTSTSKNKVTRSLGGVDNNGSGSIYLMSSLYTSSTAITSITLNAIAENFTSKSTFALYGIKEG